MLVADVEEPVVAAATRTPFEARRRVFVLERAETMSDQVANKMLKTLEEPPPFAHLVLLTSRPADLLPTVASRCQPVRFDAPPAEEIAARLAAAGRRRRPPRTRARASASATPSAPWRSPPATVPRCARRAPTSPARRCTTTCSGARGSRSSPSPAAAATPRRREIEAAVAADLELLPKKDRKRAEREAADAARRAARRARTGALDLALQVAGLWLRDVAVVRDGAEELVHATDRRADLRADAEGRDVHRLRAGVALVDEARAALAVNPTEELLLEALASRLARELAS